MSMHRQLSTQPGLVVECLAKPGDSVEKGDPLLVIEAMKFEQQIFAASEGRIDWIIDTGTIVEIDQPIALIAESLAHRPPGPDEIVDLYLEQGIPGKFTEYELAAGGILVSLPAARPAAAEPVCGVRVGVMSHDLPAHERPVRRVWICGDATHSLGAVAEPECRRIIAAIDLAEREGIPIEWITVSSGARISMDSGTENMDWCAVVVRRLVEFTQAGGEVVIVVAGINVGAQSYWNAEATMLAHCAGTLVMVEGTSMVLTGSRSLGRAGGITEASDHDLGGSGVMAANGQAHHIVENLAQAVQLVLAHHDLCARGMLHRRGQALTADEPQRDITEFAYDGPPDHGWSTVGEVLRSCRESERSQPFSIRALMRSIADCDAAVLERSTAMARAQGTVVWDTRIDGWSVTMVGIESCQRGEGDDWQAAGTLYPMGARKVARALNRASGRRPAVVLANLAGFDGSRRSLLDGQLEEGAELARAVVNFRGPLIVLVVGRFHGGAYVVLNRQLNPELKIVALGGTRVSVIGGSSAAEVVLRREVEDEMEVGGIERGDAIRNVASRFDAHHDVRRALSVGSVDLIIEPSEVRPTLASMVAEENPGRMRRALRPEDRNAARV